ncbi:MAG TPA: hypothetical protein VFX97_20745 [Pyrinomonadaceae bacterium]|nr:hypothetical protein [Pyrinomonadaceae bacterium]
MSEETCGSRTPNGVALCTIQPGHDGDHFDLKLDVSWPPEPVSPPQPEDGPDYVIPDSVRTRVELHRAQTAYDLTLLRAQLDTSTVSSTVSRRLRARREQLTAELDAWAYLAKVSRSPR